MVSVQNRTGGYGVLGKSHVAYDRSISAIAFNKSNVDAFVAFFLEMNLISYFENSEIRREIRTVPDRCCSNCFGASRAKIRKELRNAHITCASQAYSSFQIRFLFLNILVETKVRFAGASALRFSFGAFSRSICRNYSIMAQATGMWLLVGREYSGVTG